MCWLHELSSIRITLRLIVRRCRIVSVFKSPPPPYVLFTHSHVKSTPRVLLLIKCVCTADESYVLKTSNFHSVVFWPQFTLWMIFEILFYFIHSYYFFCPFVCFYFWWWWWNARHTVTVWLQRWSPSVCAAPYFHRFTSFLTLVFFSFSFSLLFKLRSNRCNSLKWFLRPVVRCLGSSCFCLFGVFFFCLCFQFPTVSFSSYFAVSACFRFDAEKRKKSV